MTRWEAHDRLKRVRNEFEVARLAIAFTLEMWDAKSGPLEHAERVGVARSEVVRLSREIESTFVIRLVAVFEGILRDYRENGLKKKPTRVDLEPLMNSIARKRKMDVQTLIDAHEVREYRNGVVHRNLRIPRLDFATCAKALSTFVAWLPQRW